MPAVLVLLAILGLTLLLVGNDDSPATGDSTAGDTATSGARLELTDTDSESVSALASLDLPPSASGFLTARLDDDSQLDVTFTMEPADEAAFLAGSGLPEPVADERVIFHASPLWELNAEGATIRGATDTTAAGQEPASGMAPVRRSLEIVDEGEVLRVRLVVTPT